MVPRGTSAWWNDDTAISKLGLPDDGGDPLKAIFYSLDAGPLVPLPTTGIGSHDLLDLFTDGVATELHLRAENQFGLGPEGPSKQITTTTAASPQSWQITDNGDGRFALSGAPLPSAAPVITNNGNGTFAVQA